jgi:hypothetical protein
MNATQQAHKQQNNATTITANIRWQQAQHPKTNWLRLMH